MRKPRGRWEDAVLRDDVDLLQLRNWKATATRREGSRKEIGRPWPENGPKLHRRRLDVG